jgi:hypothetical protein
MKPERFAREPERFEPMRLNLNRALAFAGLAVEASGALGSVEAAKTLSQATRRARELKSDLTSRGVHPDVLRFCREELLADNYFHAVLVLLCHKTVLAAWTSWQPPRQGVGESNPDGGD